MAERRMFAKTIVTSDPFLDMPASARCLYFMLGMMADDDGFVNAPRSVMRQAGSSMDDMNLLIAKRFVLTFESGVVVIKHWKIHNLIQKDRYKETKYLEEKAQLVVDANNAYTEAENALDTPCIQSVSKVETQDRLGKDRLGEDRLDNKSGKAVSEMTKTVIGYLNQKAGTCYKASSAKTKELVSARMNEGFTEEDFFTVIDNKVAEWGKPPKQGEKDMRVYIRPTTLFGTKFEAYLNQRRVSNDGEHERIGGHLI